MKRSGVLTSGEVNKAIQSLDFERAYELRGHSFKASFDILRTLVRAFPHPPQPGQQQLRIAVFNVGAPSPGMNATGRAAVRQLAVASKRCLLIEVMSGYCGYLAMISVLFSGAERVILRIYIGEWRESGTVCC